MKRWDQGRSTIDRLLADQRLHPAPDVPPVSEDELAETLPKVEAVIDVAAKVVKAMPVWT